MTETVSADYLVIGAGAMGMAFVDTLLTDTRATFAVVDRWHRPGGHWNTAYPFVRLHQPSAYYGVNSRPLGENKIDVAGWNKGLHELATNDEVLAYYDKVLNHTFLPSGRVAYYPKCDYTGGGEFRSLVSGKKFSVGKETRIVDATYMRVKVPSMAPPKYGVADDVKLVTPNDLTKISRPYANYTVVGAGKTGMDANLWLLAAGVDPSKITWIMPRDSWLLPRHIAQPKTPKFAEPIEKDQKLTEEVIMAATSAADLLRRLEAGGQLMRLTGEVWPTMFRCASVSLIELDALRKIPNVVRLGRVRHIGAGKVTLEGGKLTPAPDTLYVDCTADGLEKRPAVPVFDGGSNTITLQAVRACQQVFSAAFIAHVEAAYGDGDGDGALKNELCRPIPHPTLPLDWLVTRAHDYTDMMQWYSEPKLAAWLAEARLDWFGKWAPPLPDHPEERAAAGQARVAKTKALRGKLQQLLDEEKAGEA
ncbi:hypothetical protein LA080_000990 [Diaporthe eres]|uniref:NAD(P)/FAD-dependent oxidoreductase n=1 Tax=Diaporthe vaccinii TaxID=105482 RepID=A0ABR4FD40_9PEZI|nr:hypothetical protein LA080_000990 [Diaporthe eres]